METLAPPPYLLREQDRRLFKRCRRAWDLGATTRRNLVPRRPARIHDLDRALRDALAIYYFPGMWTWNRAIVYPSVLEAFARSMGEQRDAQLAEHRLTEAEELAWRSDHELGEAMLRNYFTWAPTVDRFTPAWVGVEFGRGIPDPARPGQEVVTSEGREVRVRERIEVLVKDEEDVPWLLYHRVVDGAWTDLHQLELDERGLLHSWAWELDYLGWTIGGVIYHELRRAAPAGGVPTDVAALPARSMPPWDPLAALDRPPSQPRVPLRSPEASGPRLLQEETPYFRRTRILRTREEVAAVGRQVILEVEDMTDPQVRVHPHPSPESCGGCDFREPCAAMYRGEDATPLLEAGYRPRGDDGATWRLGSRGMLGRGSLPWKAGR
ncbi:MAG TPA: hypothetical protein VGL20_17585 [Candidatus Dormibacteraeota bacterium]